MGKRTTFGVLLLNAVIVFLSLGFRHQTLVHLTEITQGYSSSLPYLIMNLELLFFTLLIGIFLNAILIAVYMNKK